MSFTLKHDKSAHKLYTSFFKQQIDAPTKKRQFGKFFFAVENILGAKFLIQKIDKNKFWKDNKSNYSILKLTVKVCISLYCKANFYFDFYIFLQK